MKKLEAEFSIVQPFEYGIHLDKGFHPYQSDALDTMKVYCKFEPEAIPRADRRVWRSFAANYEEKTFWEHEEYDFHGHVGFARGCRREVLEALELYERALIGGADHIIAHACVCQIGHSCIRKAWVDVEDQAAIEEHSVNLYARTIGGLGYVQEDLYHLWHGELKDREYLK